MGADCLSTWLEDHNTCPMCRTTLFEQPAITFPVPQPHMLAAMAALSGELLQRVPLARAEVAEHVGEASEDDGAIPRVDSSQLAVQDGALSAGLPPPTVADDLALARALDAESTAALARLRELVTESGTGQSTGEMIQVRDRMMEIQRQTAGIRERMRGWGLSEEDYN